MEYLLIAGAWAGYLGLHSFLASSQLKDLVRSKVPFLSGNYRFFYSLISVIGIFGLLYLMAVMPSEPLFAVPGYLRYVAMILSSYGVILVVTSFRHASAFAFLGFKKAVPSKLVREGVHAHVRHPIYTGTILIFMGMFLYHPTDIILSTVIVNFAYLPFGMKWEEQKLLAEFGAEYEEYKTEVPALFPRIKR